MGMKSKKEFGAKSAKKGIRKS